MIWNLASLRVESYMFKFLNLRSQQIIRTNAPFGGISFVTVGDLFQLTDVNR